MKRLYRIKDKGIIGGVCAGLGEYLNVDPIIIRIIMLLLLFRVSGLIIYLVMMIALPVREQASTPEISEPPSEMQSEEQVEAHIMDEQAEGQIMEEQTGEPLVMNQPVPNHPKTASAADSGLWAGFALIIIGGLILLRNFGIDWFYWVRFRTVWPLILIAAGVYILFRKDGGKRD